MNKTLFLFLTPWSSRAPGGGGQGEPPGHEGVSRERQEATRRAGAGSGDVS